MRSKTVSSTPPWPLHQLLPPGFCPVLISFDDEQQCRSIRRINPFLPKLIQSWWFITLIETLTKIVGLTCGSHIYLSRLLLISYIIDFTLYIKKLVWVTQKVSTILLYSLYSYLLFYFIPRQDNEQLKSSITFISNQEKSLIVEIVCLLIYTCARVEIAKS